jgi:hypothetical protein
MTPGNAVTARKEFPVSTWIGSSLVHPRLVLVLQVVLHVPHLVVSREEIFHVDSRALLYPAKKNRKYL